MHPLEDNSNTGLEVLLRSRFHGAVNIRGIRYQILYSVLRSFDLYDMQGGVAFLRLEGIEDVDLVGMRLSDEYVQIKSSQSPWNWSQLKDPIKGFINVYRADPGCTFVLIVSFQLQKDLLKLANRESLQQKEKLNIENNFINLCRKIGASDDEARGLLNKMVITSLPEDQLWKELKQSVSKKFRVESEAVDIFISALVAKFLDWAKDRKTVTHKDLDNIRTIVGEALSSESEFQAHGRGLIGRVCWEPDSNLTDFFDGKGTRPGHIAANIDIRRASWLEKIDSALLSSKICVLRSSSGQGKSALLYRYAYEKWSEENTFVLRAAESSDQVELIRNYLRFKANLGLPLLLIIDNAGWQTRLWPIVVQECAALGIRVLISIRNEDWHRFALESLTSYEILEPMLDLNEAREIFSAFLSEKRLHKSVDTAEWAYERIGEPHLLIEYVYLITHGQMLEERLRDQVKQFSIHQEDPAKIEILRKVALADTLGAPVIAEKLMKDLKLINDSQQVLKSLIGEYLNLNYGVITGLHWVRSDHLTQILHEGYPDPGSTALSIIEAISPESISKFVSNAICMKNINANKFINGLVEKSKDANIDTVLAFIEGLFKAGERRFFEENHKLFDEAYEISGFSGVFCLSSAFMPVIKLDTIDDMCQIFRDERGQNFRKLREIVSRAKETERGLSLVHNFLISICPIITPKIFQTHFGSSGLLLDWCSLCDVPLPAWHSASDTILASKAMLNIPLNDFCIFSQGLYRYNVTEHRDWFLQNREDILGYLRLQTDCIKIDVSDNILSIEFFFDPEGNDSDHKKIVSRLNKLRSAIPFCERYQSQGIWLLPFGLTPSVDDTFKDISEKDLHFDSDIEKNVIWWKAVEGHYLPDSYYRYEEAWYALRCDALLFIQRLSKGLQRTLEGKKFDFQEAFEGGKLPNRLVKSLQHILQAPPQTPKHLKKSITKGPDKWSNSLQNFLIQMFQYVENPSNQRIGRLSVSNFLDAIKILDDLHNAFSDLFKNAPDYFQAKKLDVQEDKFYPDLADLLEIWILDRPRTQQKNVMRYIMERRERRRQETLERLHDVLSPLIENGISIILPEDIHMNHPLSYLPLAFSVEDPCYFDKEFYTVLETLMKVKDTADFFCLVPIHHGSRFLEGGYNFSSIQLAKLGEGGTINWEAFMPQELPEGVLHRLPKLPFSVSIRYQFRITMISLIGLIEAIAQQEKKIESLKLHSDHFDAELYARQRSRILKLKNNLAITASKAETYMNVEFSTLKEEEYFKNIQNCLAILIEAPKKGDTGNLFILEHQDIEKISESIELLLRSGRKPQEAL